MRIPRPSEKVETALQTGMLVFILITNLWILIAVKFPRIEVEHPTPEERVEFRNRLDDVVRQLQELRDEVRRAREWPSR